MKNVNEVLQQKTHELAQVRLQVDALRLAAMLLVDDSDQPIPEQPKPEGVSQP